MLCVRRVIFSGALLGLLSCSRSPQGYLESGNKFAREHKDKEASIQYRKAIQADPQFGEAFYRLALSELEQQNIGDAYRYLVRAVELMPDNQAAKVKLADISLTLYWVDPRHPRPLYDQLAKLADQLLAKNPNSFDALRLKGSQAMLDRKPKEAILYFGKADAAKPAQPSLLTEYVQALLADGQAERAERLALELESRESSYGAIYDVLYTYYLKANRAADAEGQLKRKVAGRPTDSDAILQLASHYARTGKPEQTAAALQRLTDDPKSFPKGRLQAGNLYSQFGDWSHALQQFEEGARLNSTDKLPYEKAIVNALLAQGKAEDASRRLDSLVKAYPTDLESKAVQSSVWLLSGEPKRIEAALTQLQDLTKQKPDDLNLRYGLAQAYRATRNWDYASAQFQEVLRRNKGHLEAKLALAEISLAQNKPGETLRYADEILAVDPQNRRGRLFRAMSFTWTQNYPDAHRELNRILTAFPQDPDALVQAGLLAILERRYQEARGIFNKLRQGRVQDLRSLAGLVDSYMEENQYEKIIQVLDGELKKSPDAPAVRGLLAYVATRAGKYDLALEQYRKLLAVRPDSLDLYMSMAAVHQKKRDRAGVIADLQKAKEISPQTAYPRLALAILFEQSGRLDEAKANYERVVEIQPDNFVALNNLAFLLAETGGNLDRALQLAQRAQQKQPQELIVSDTIGWIYLKKNLHDSAISIFSLAVKKQPDNPTFRYHLGLALLKKGDRMGARTELDVALTKDPSQEEERKIKEAIDSLG